MTAIPAYLKSKKLWRHVTVRLHEDREKEFTRIAAHMDVTLTAVTEFFLNWADFNPNREWEKALMNYLQARALRRSCAMQEFQKRRRQLPTVLSRANRAKVKKRLARRRGWS